jgi:mono/diheme cytochrome c family protein
LVGCNFHHSKGEKGGEQLLTGGGDAFAKLNEQLFGPSCHACHNPGVTRGGVDLTSFGSVRNGRGPTGAPLVVPGNSAGSELYDSIASGRMPKGPKVSDELLRALACWIDNGAPETGGGDCFAVVEPPPPGGDEGGTDQVDGGTDQPDGGTDDHPGDTDDGGTDDPADGGADDPADGGDGHTPPAVKFAEVYEKVLKPACEMCHAGDRASAGVDLTSAASVLAAKARLMGDPANPEMLVVKPGSLEDSLLWKVVTTPEPTFPELMRMPSYADPLTSEELDLVRRWIEGGAARD